MDAQTHYERVRPAFMQGLPMAREILDELEKAKAPLWKALPFVVQKRRVDLLIAIMSEAIRRMMKRQADPFSYGQLSRDQDFVQLVSFMVSETNRDPSELLVIVVAECQMLWHEMAGKRVYDVTPALAGKLAHTELRGITSDDLRLPYESVYLMTPVASELKIWNVETGWHRCEGIYITEDQSLDLDEPSKVIDGLMIQDTDGPRVRGWRMMGYGQPLEDKYPELMKHGNDAISFWKVFLPAGKPLDEVIDLTQARMESDMARYGADTSRFKGMNEEWKRVFRWAMNAMLYVTWTEPGENWIADKEARQLWERMQKLPGGPKRQRLNERYRQIDPKRRIIIGHNVQVEPAENPGVGRELTVRTRVQGHWRNQAHGPAHTLRKLIWIEPFWRGPDDGVLGPTTHEVR